MPYGLPPVSVIRGKIYSTAGHHHPLFFPLESVKLQRSPSLGLVFLVKPMGSYRERATEISLMSKDKVITEEILGCARIGIKKGKRILLCMQTESAKASVPCANTCHLPTPGERRFWKKTGRQRLQGWFCPSFLSFF